MFAVEVGHSVFAVPLPLALRWVVHACKGIKNYSADAPKWLSSFKELACAEVSQAITSCTRNAAREGAQR